jgi:YgiT-type zinc finger domain-containing protein
MNMKCPVCGAAELIHDTHDLPYTYKGETTTIPAVTADFCPACDESITDMAETERVMREMQAFNKQVNAAIVDQRTASTRRHQRFESVWDVIEDTPEQAEAMKAWSRELMERKRAAKYALASVMLEGFEPSDNAKEKMRQYIDGEITLDELVRLGQ